MDRPIPTYSAALRRTPHRVRELKYGIASQSEKLAGSHPSQSEGVEITTREGVTITGYSRTPHRVRELKFIFIVRHFVEHCVAPLTGCGS